MPRFNRIFALATLALLTASAPLSAFASNIFLARATTGRNETTLNGDFQVANLNRVLNSLSVAALQNRFRFSNLPNNFQLTFPSVVYLKGDGPGNVAGISTKVSHANASGITLQFDSTGSGAFPVAYQTLLQNVFNSAQSTLNLLFGSPSVGGVVHVANYNSSIGDRNAVAGGYYLPNNGSGVPEIRFPIYNQNESAAINFVHCLLLAYLGPNGYNTDAYEEGLVRAVTMRVVRTAGAMPSGLDPTLMETDLETTYDTGSTYDWNNQRALGSPQFIAPNLLSSPLPASGGAGLYLMRYEMAGSAWAKVLAEYPTFIAQLNTAVAANPSLGNNIQGLTSEGQTILNSLRPSDPTIEGQSFSDWVKHQFILQTTATQGTKLFAQATPITSGLAAPDFGVFILEATYFSVDGSGNETLLSGTSYPIFWDNTFNRFTTSSQDQQISLSASQGTIAPNLTDLYAGQPYRATVDIPVADQLSRVYLPAGAIATATATTPNDFYGTVSGANLLVGDTLQVQLLVGGTVIGTYNVSNNAFGVTVGTAGNFNNGNVPITVNVLLTRGSATTTILTRRIDKSEPGGLGVDLRIASDTVYGPSGGLPKGLSFLGFPIDPYVNDASDLFGVPASSLLLAKYNSTTAAFDIYPSCAPPSVGTGYFLRLDAAQPTFTYTGLNTPNVVATIALKPGWNMISAPFIQSIPTSSVQVVHTTEFPVAYGAAMGTTLGADFFQFNPGNADPVTGAPEGGTFTAGTTFVPGNAYYVRVLAPEGVTLAFTPASTANNSGANTGGSGGTIIGSGAGGNTTHRAFGSGSSGTPIDLVSDRHWTIQMIAAVNGKQSDVLVGEDRNGSNQLNLRLDSTLPPGFGGLQAGSTKGALLYRDIRPLGSRQFFKISVKGLVAGQNINLNFKLLAGILHIFTFYDVGTGKTITGVPGSVMNFTATGTTENFVLETTGQ